MAKKLNHKRYIVKSIVHASEILRTFHSRGEVLRLRDIVERTGFDKSMCFRILYTLQKCGIVGKIGENQYQLVSEIHANRRYRIGYASQGQGSSFMMEVRKGLVMAADAAEVELLTVDNKYDPKVALHNTEFLIHEGVDLVIEFQADDSMDAPIAARYLEARIPLIAIDIPHPGATYFGVNNYEVGLIAGRYLGRWCRGNWEGRFDEILLIEIAGAGSLPRTRLTGILAGLKEILRVPGNYPIVTVDGDGRFEVALNVVRKHLRISRSKQILVGAANDPSALGALRAFQESGRENYCAIVGQNCEPEARTELRRKNSRFIGTVAYFPEKYGEGLIKLALDILAHKAVQPAVFVRHQLVHRENVDRWYSGDGLLGLGSN